MMAKIKLKNNKKYKTIGWREWVVFPEFSNFAIKAKIDTGARSSALHATHIVEFEKNNQKWIKFRVYQSRKFLYIETPIVGYKKITNSFGKAEIRPTIELKIKLGKNSWNTEITLARRSKLTHPMLIGRKSLKKKYIVYPHKSYIMDMPNQN